MPVSQTVLGMNARNYLYIRRYNPPSAKHIADDKLLTKQLLIKHKIATPAFIAAFKSRDEIRQFDWKLPENGFAIKPARGYGGGGIIAFKKWYGRYGKTMSGEEISIKDIETHLLDILDGAYSLQFLPDYAIIEDLVRPHPFFKKINSIGLPDIRVIVYHHIPVMAMIRVPTEKSKGKANLAQGAIALGIDIRTGITNYAYMKHHAAPRYMPGTKIKTRGIKIPHWEEILLLASRTQSASRLGYAGIDIVIDAKSGPMVLEVNARPGLSIQNANHSSLRTRLERVEHMQPLTPERGVEVAKSLFASPSLEKVDTKPRMLGIIEEVEVIGRHKKSEQVEAKVDTGAYRTSIDSHLAKKLDLPELEHSVVMKSASAGIIERPTVPLVMRLGGKKIKTIATVTDRSHMHYKLLIGRRDLKGFLVDPDKEAPTHEMKQEKKFEDVPVEY